MDSKSLGSAGSLRKGDFLFEGDAAKLLPVMLAPVVGDLREYVGQAAVPVEKKDVAEGEKKVEEEEE